MSDEVDQMPVGREHDIRQIVGLVDRPDVSLVTVIGPGGIGKSAVASAAIAELTDAGRRVGTCDLTAAGNAAQAMAALRAAWEQDDIELLAIESLERLGGEVTDFAALLRSRTGRTVLATSRSATNLSAEFQYVLGPLDWDTQLAAETAGRVPAAQQLFTSHAKRFLTTEQLDAGFPLVTDICRQVAGVPLAIITVAHQLSTMSLTSLRQQLIAGAGPLMHGPSDLSTRHATVAAAVRESLDSLSAESRSAACALAVFEQAVEPQAALAVLGSPPHDGAVRSGRTSPVLGESAAALGVLRELVLASMLMRSEPVEKAPLAYLMLAPVRDAVRILGEDACRAARAPHATYFYDRVLDGARCGGRDHTGWFAQTDRDLADIRAALRHLIDGSDIRAARMAAALRPYFLARGLLQEGIEWTGEALELAADERDETALIEARAILVGAASSYANVVGDLELCAQRWSELGEDTARARTMVDLAGAIVEVRGFEAARPVFEEAIDQLELLGDDWWAAKGRLMLGASAAGDGTHRELAMSNLDRATAAFQRLGDSSFAYVPLQQVGRMLHEEGHDTQAITTLLEGLEGALATGDAWNASVFHNLLAEVKLSRGQVLEAAHHTLDSMRLAAGIGARPRLIWCLEGLAVSMNELGEAEYAARLVGLSSSIRATLGLRNWVEFPARAVDLTSVLTGQSRERFEIARAAGARMSVGDVLAYAPDLLRAKESNARPATLPAYPDGLTNREAEVLALIASGMTSKAIAAELFISIETVSRHISNLYRKIGASGRAEATAYAIRAGLTRD